MSILPQRRWSANWRPPERILVIGPSWIGDAVMAQSLYRLLQQRNPGVAIDVLAPAWSAELLARMPQVRRAIAMPLGHGELGLGARHRLGRELRSHRYDQAIVLPNSLKSALIPFWSRITRRTGFVGEMRWGLLNDVRRLDKARLARMVDRFATLALEPDQPLPQPLPRPALRIEAEHVILALQEQGLRPPSRPVLGLCPGAEYGPAKRWPTAFYAQVAKAKLRQGWEVWIFGSRRDAALGREINDGTGGACIDLTGRTPLARAVDLLSLASAVISNDSGLMHVAAALDRPLVAVYGSSTPRFTPPLSLRAQTVSLELPCSPCFKRQCPLGHTRCLRTLEPARVLEAMEAKRL